MATISALGSGDRGFEYRPERLSHKKLSKISVFWIIREIGWSGMDRKNVAQNRDGWRALVKKVMNLRVPKILENSSIAEKLVVS
jgi:hypothetical protein